MSVSKDSRYILTFPIDALPTHIALLLKQNMTEYLPTFGYVLSIPLANQSDPKNLYLNAWEFLLFTFFTCISKLDKPRVSDQLYKSIILDDESNLVNMIVQNFEIYLFSKYFLFEFDEASHSFTENLDLFAYLAIEFLINPINSVEKVNKELREYKRDIGSSTKSFMQTDIRPLPKAQNPKPTQLLFIQAMSVIMKSHWKSYLSYSVHSKDMIYEGGIGMAFFKNMHYWLKCLLIQNPDFTKGIFLQIGCIYITLIAPPDEGRQK